MMPGSARGRGWIALVLAVAPAALGACRSRAPEPVRPRPLVLVTIDTLRADHVGAYGYPRDTTPNLDRMAAEGVLFEQAIASSSHTGPSHASLLTSRQPFQHGLKKNGQRLPPGNRTLAELLAAAGYDTAAFASVGFLAELGRGFGRMEAEWRSGDRTVDAAIAWLDARPATAPPFFLWVHLYDPHKLKGPRENLRDDVEWLRSQGPEARRRLLDHVAARGLPPDYYADDEELLVRYDVYDAGIRFADRQLGRLRERVEASDPDARWIVTSDHGEGLGNHHYDEHGRYLYDEQLRVPLVVLGAEGPPRRVGRLVRLVDILPTVVAWIGGAGGGPGGTSATVEEEGYPLFGEPAATGGLPPRFAFSERRPKDRSRVHRRWLPGEVYSLRSADLKYIYRSHGHDALYDLARDPYELANRIAEDAAKANELRRLLLDYVGRNGRGEGVSDEAGEEPTAHDAELKALGYL